MKMSHFNIKKILNTVFTFKKYMHRMRAKFRTPSFIEHMDVRRITSVIRVYTRSLYEFLYMLVSQNNNNNKTIFNDTSSVSFARCPRFITDDFKKISPSAKELLLFLLARPANWEINKSYLVSKTGWGYKKLSKIFNELKDIGHLHEIKCRNNEGRYSQSHYYCTAIPTDVFAPDSPSTQNRHVGFGNCTYI